MIKSRQSRREKDYRETLNDAQFAIAVLAIASGTLISFIILATLWFV
ncbi:hypothetical protein EZJ58_1744 [Sodalis ligni]|uniref:Uncharacterized protein n=1 Tax=Sodalis ligni TaxID=2697027 RepID=A0A4R1NAC8_9GAMM|nr:hypothetical protein EZJ58_1744 [Sodalis ligni]